ncbi:hypothetical protein ACEV9B_23635, partial [Vibrio parahaemolyticus]
HNTFLLAIKILNSRFMLLTGFVLTVYWRSWLIFIVRTHVVFLKFSTTANTVQNSSAIADVEIMNGYGEWHSE